MSYSALSQNDLNKHFDILTTADEMEFGDIHFKINHETQLHAIIAIHNTNLGPALGGCRCVQYTSNDGAIFDAMRLAQGMSYKAAIAGLPTGGGKSVLIKPPEIRDREAYFESFGEFVEELGGRYITAVDSGTSVEDMDIIARKTQHVVSTSALTGDPSPQTALGVLKGIQAAVKHKLGRDDLEGIHVAIQGAGNVGYNLAKLLHDLGAQISVCSNKQVDVDRFVDEFGANGVSKDKIFEVHCDVFAPCALGGIITANSLAKMQAKIIAGAANNQLSDPTVNQVIQSKGILYAPDYVINAGGLIHVTMMDPDKVQAKVNEIYDTLLEIFSRADEEQAATSFVAEEIAKERIAKAKA